LRVRIEQVESKVGRPDRVDLGRDQVAAVLEARGGAGKTEGQQQSQQPEYRGFRGSDAFGETLRVARDLHNAESASQFGSEQHEQEERDGAKQRQHREGHWTSPAAAARLLMMAP
jgi:hypothetical protein